MAGLTRVISNCMIRPASGDSHRDFSRRIELNPSDVIFLLIEYSQVGLLFRKPDETCHSFKRVIENLKATLSLALDRLYPLAGRLVAVEHDDGDVNTRSFSISCSGAGVTFVHADAVNTVSVAEILDPVVVPREILSGLFPMNGILNHEAADLNLPLLAVQVTELADGVFVSVSMSHCAADGTSFYEFINVWSELARGDCAAILRRESFQFSHELHDFPIRVRFNQNEVSAGHVPPMPAAQRRMLHFSKEKVAELKAKANAAEPRRSGSDSEISSLQALMAHLWVCITHSKALRYDDTVCYGVLVGLRSRLLLPPSYFGNAVKVIFVTCTAGELLSHGMGWAARRINKAIAAQTEEEARKFFFNHANYFSPQPSMPPNGLTTGGSPHFDVFGNDFGWGKPLAMRTGPMYEAIPGRLNVAASVVEGSIDFEAALSPETFRALASDPEFTKYSSLLQ